MIALSDHNRINGYIVKPINLVIMKELRIFIVGFDEWDRHRFEFDVEGGLLTMSDDDFMTVAECIGDVYTLQGFQDDWNDGIAPMNDYSIMRIFEVDVPSE